MLAAHADADLLDATFHALADRTRRAILARLAAGEASVTELAAPFAMSQPSISRHLKVLEAAGLIERGQAAQFRPRRLKPEALKEAALWVEQVRDLWADSFDRLDEYLRETARADEASRPKTRKKGASRGRAK